MVRRRLPDGAMVWYVVINIFTLGLFYFLKITIMKAIIDTLNARDLSHPHYSPLVRDSFGAARAVSVRVSTRFPQ